MYSKRLYRFTSPASVRFPNRTNSMNDIRRTILWVVFALSSILLWDKWQVHNGRPATFFPGPAATVQGPQGAGTAPSAVPAATGASGASALLPGQAEAAPAALQPASERIEVTH